MQRLFNGRLNQGLIHLSLTQGFTKRDALVGFPSGCEAPADLLDALKARAKELRRPYQTLMKEVLRQNLQIAIPGHFDFDALMQKVQEINTKLDHVQETEDQILAKRA
ncbi:hypothetical protein WDW86_18405 [Bdellovibrionota bacterium FG-2]